MREIYTSFTLLLGLAAWTAAPAAAQSFIDASKPMTGKSEFVFNVDGTPADIGVVAKAAPAPAAPEVSGPATVRMRGTAANAPEDSNGSASDGVRRARSVFVVTSGGGRPNAQQVSGYQRKDGTTVAPYVRKFGRRR
jgi:hypothetical protein